MGSMGLTFDIAELIDYFQGKVDGLEEWGTQVLDGMAEAVRVEMVAESPWVTGMLREGHEVFEVGEWTREIYSDVPYFDWVVGGTSPHDIYPVNKQALWWPEADHPVRHVHHPGAQPNDYPLTALENAQGIIEEIVDKALQELVN